MILSKKICEATGITAVNLPYYRNKFLKKGYDYKVISAEGRNIYIYKKSAIAKLKKRPQRNRSEGGD